MSLYEYKLRTETNGLFDITDAVMNAVSKEKAFCGICVIYCPHTTSGITINENADLDVKEDFLLGMEEIIPALKEFKHQEGNSAAHIKSSLIGASQSVIIHNGNLLLGVWQSIYFAEFDAPRNRMFYVKIVKN